ncbi:MAG: citrate/2-methylcitrate synthase [SAR202 cluster bacterium]|jgi:citrate synthase|nr:citrate/2-methylcitrate synthase [SAR202 cluster bacterium]MDP6716596.1 citrate/2-methylcitrate synthase [SAR202 cluster bacterium]
MTEQKVQLHRGLREVYIDRSTSSFIDGDIGKLLYRGYNIDELAVNSNFEETAYLVMYGELPTQAQLDEFDAKLKAARSIPDEIVDIIKLTRNSHPMDVLRTAISALSAYDPDTEDNSSEATLRKGLRLTAQAPTIVAAHARVRDGKDPIAPDSSLNQAANFLNMLFGELPEPVDADLIDKDFVLHVEHGINASSFGARVAASTVADLHCAVTTGVAVLKGPSHGGAAEEVMKMAQEIGTEENAEKYVRERLDGGGRIMGFGHRVYKAVDPRSVHLQDDAKALGERKGEPKWFSILQNVIEAMEPYRRRGIYQNVDFFSGTIYYLLGIPDDLFISIFAMGRIPGWTAQVVEQFENNILLRPRLLYTGEMDVPYVPIADRG